MATSSVESENLPGLDPDIAQRFIDLCAKASEGELVARILPTIGWSRRKLYRIVESSDQARALYSRARISQAHALAEETISISDGTDELGVAYRHMADLAVDEMDPKDRWAWLRAFDTNRVARDKSRVAARTWYTSKLAPKIYGEKLDITSNGDAIHPGVVLLPAQDAPLIPPADGVVLETVTRVAISGRAQETTKNMAELMYEFRQGRLVGEPVDESAGPETPHAG